MNVIKNPDKNEWLAYTQRPALERQELTALVEGVIQKVELEGDEACLLYTSPSPRDVEESRMPSSA